jgi:FkbM family methyltransferase
MILTTKKKIALAGIAYRAVAMGRAIVGKKDRVTVRRSGFRWDLDLHEGIDFSIYLLGAFERSTERALHKLVRPGDIVFDIGSNLGAHTLGLAQSVGPTGAVFAFEPADYAFAKLKRNLSLNPQLEARTHAHQILLAARNDAPRQAELYASWPLTKCGSVHPKHQGRLVTTSQASVDTLDSFVAREGIDRLNVIKIDVDGFEYPVLMGGLRALAKFRPILVMEMSPYVHTEQSQSFEALVALLRKYEYSLQDAGTWRPLPLRSEQLEALIPDGAGINVIARPTEKWTHPIVYHEDSKESVAK